MFEIVFIVSMFLVALFCVIAWTKEIPYFFALASLILFLTSIILMIDGGIELQSYQIIQNTSTGITNVNPLYDSNVMLSIAYADSPLLWGLSYIGFFMGFLLMGYSLGMVVKRGAINESRN